MVTDTNSTLYENSRCSRFEARHEEFRSNHKFKLRSILYLRHSLPTKFLSSTLWKHNSMFTYDSMDSLFSQVGVIVAAGENRLWVLGSESGQHWSQSQLKHRCLSLRNLEVSQHKQAFVLGGDRNIWLTDQQSDSYYLLVTAFTKRVLVDNYLWLHSEF